MNHDSDLLDSLKISSNIHYYYTRNNSEYRIPKYYKNKCKNNIKIIGPKIWNTIPQNLHV